jgi:hypothetical protein
MPISQQLFRNNVGNYHNTINKKSINQVAQQNMLYDLSKCPGDAAKRARALLILQSILMISNISLTTGEALVRSQAFKTAKTRNLAGLAKTPYSLLPSAYSDVGAPTADHHSSFFQRAGRRNRGAATGKSTGIYASTRLVKPNSTLALSAESVSDIESPTSGRTKRGKKYQEDRKKNPVFQLTQKSRRFLEKYFKENIKNDVASIIDKTILYIISCPDGLESLSSFLVKNPGEYGAHEYEKLSLEQQYGITRHWLSQLLFKYSLGEFIGRVIAQTVLNNGCSDRQPVKLSNDILFSYILGKIGMSKEGAAERIEEVYSFDKTAQNYLIHEVLFMELPCLALRHEDMDNHNLHAGTVDWGFLHVGLLIARRTEKDISQISIDELIQLGSSLEDMLREGVIDAELVSLFLLPAKLLYIKQQAEQSGELSMEKIFRSVEGNEMALEAFFAASERQKVEESPFNQFSQALGNFRTRTQLREMLSTSDVMVDNNRTALNEKAAGPLCQGGVRPSVLENADADLLFKEQNENIAAKFAVVDMLMVALAFEQLPRDEVDFLRTATIYKASADFSAFDEIRYQIAVRVLPRRAHTVPLSLNVDLFAASQDGNKRIYALQYMGERYELNRVDYDEKLYYELMADSIQVSRNKEYKLRVYDNNERELLKSAAEPLEQLAGRLIQKHRNNFLHQLHEQGYEETTGEKAQRFLLSLIPFYNCISGIVNQENEAPISCALDMILLVPLAGQGLGLASRFAQQGFKGGIMAYRSAMGSLVARETLRTAIRQAGREFVRHGMVAAAGELNKKAFIQLGVTLLRSVDPGVELASIIGTHALRQMTAAGRLLKEIIPAWKKVLPDLEAVLLHQREPLISAKYIETGRLPGIDKDVQVKKLQGAKYKRQPVYAQVDLVTGNVFGKKYTRDSMGMLHTVPKPMAQRLKNILESGLSGRGAGRAASRMAVQRRRGIPPLQKSPPVKVDHILRWVENAHSLSPLARQEFLTHFGLSENVWSDYVSPAGELTVAAQNVMREAGMYEYNLLFTLPSELQREIIQKLDIGPVQNLLRAFPSHVNEPIRAASLRSFAAERLASLQQRYARAWSPWLAQSLPAEKRWLAWERLNIYFDGLNPQLILKDLFLSDLPAILPDDVIHLDLSGNRLSGVTQPLSDNILSLDISTNFFSQLPTPLPAKLSMLDASHNFLTQIPTSLSQRLVFLDLSHNMLTSMPVLPDCLSFLDVSNNNLYQLPLPLPKSLTRLSANNNQLRALPDLPDGMSWLEVRNNQLLSLPVELPPKMTFLDIASNHFVSLPPMLPTRLKTLDITCNRIVELPFLLPPRLEKLYASKNLLTFFPPYLPPKLSKLYASGNLLASTPPYLPPGLKVLVLNHNLIEVVLPNLPHGLKTLQLTNNFVSTLPEVLPRALQILFINRNPIARLPGSFPPSMKEIDASDTNIPGRPANLPVGVNFIQNP